MSTIHRKTVLGRRNRLSAGGVLVAALGLAGLFLALSAGWNAGNLAVFLIEAVGGLALTMIGFMLMVLGADPFSDNEGEFPGEPVVKHERGDVDPFDDTEAWMSPPADSTGATPDITTAATDSDR